MKLIHAAAGFCLTLVVADANALDVKDCRITKPDNFFVENPMTCEVTELKLFSNRAHIRCKDHAYNYTPDKFGGAGCNTGIYYFAAPIGEAGPFVATAAAAMQLKKTLLIGFRLQDQSATQYNCQETDCRKPVTILLRP